MRKFLLGIAAAAAAWPALAVPITGELSIAGTNDTDLLGGTITFTGAFPLSTGGETGSFAGLGTGGIPTLRNEGAPIPFGTLASGSDLPCGAGCIYTVASGGLTATFDLLAENAPIETGGFLDISGTGTVALSGFDPTPASFSLSTQGGTGTNLTFSATTVAVPGPVLGAGLPGLAAAAGAAAMAMLGRRRKRDVR